MMIFFLWEIFLLFGGIRQIFVQHKMQIMGKCNGFLLLILRSRMDLDVPTAILFRLIFVLLAERIRATMFSKILEGKFRNNLAVEKYLNKKQATLILSP